MKRTTTPSSSINRLNERKMKKTYILMAALLLAASCEKAVIEPEAPAECIRTFKASFSDLTRTDLGDGLTPLWSAGDAVWLSDGVHQEVVGVGAEYVGQATAEFSTSTLTGETIYALYPATSAIGRTGESSVYFNIPASTDGAFNHANICVAVTTDDDLCFKNATSMIRFTKSEADVVSLSIVRPDERIIAGRMFFRPWDGYHLGDGHIWESSINVDMSGPGPYYVALFPQPLPAGTKFVMTTSDGKTYVRTINVENNFTVNKIKTISVDAAFSGATLVPEDGWSGSGTETDPYLIASAADLMRLATKVNDRVDYFPDKYFKQVKDITVSNFRPIGSTNEGNGFQGYFDGCHHVITIESFDLSYLSTQSTNGYEVYMGLFGWARGSSMSDWTRVIRNVQVAGTIDTGSSFVRGPHYYGAICGLATGNLKFESCSSSLNMRLFGYYANYPSRAKLMAAGGLVGYAAADVQIQRSWNTGDLAAYSNANSGNRFYVGGICGNLYGGLIRLCYNTGNITAQMTQSGYGAFVAGIAASNTTSGKVEGSYNQGKIIAYGANATSAKAVGITYNAQALGCYNSGVIKSYNAGSSSTPETAYSAGISYRQSGEYKHCFYLQGTASSDFLGSGGTITYCDYFVTGDATNGGLLGTDGKPLLDAMNEYEATTHFFIGPPGNHFPVLEYVSRSILDN